MPEDEWSADTQHTRRWQSSKTDAKQLGEANIALALAIDKEFTQEEQKRALMLSHVMEHIAHSSMPAGSAQYETPNLGRSTGKMKANLATLGITDTEQNAEGGLTIPKAALDAVIEQITPIIERLKAFIGAQNGLMAELAQNWSDRYDSPLSAAYCLDTIQAVRTEEPTNKRIGQTNTDHPLIKKHEPGGRAD